MTHPNPAHARLNQPLLVVVVLLVAVVVGVGLMTAALALALLFLSSTVPVSMVVHMSLVHWSLDVKMRLNLPRVPRSLVARR